MRGHTFSPVPITPAPPADPVAAAFSRHLAGRRKEAEDLCRVVLEWEPRHAGALHLLAAMAHSQGRPRPALKLARLPRRAARRAGKKTSLR